MRTLVAAAVNLATICCIGAWAQEPRLAAEGRGLLPVPATAPAGLQGAVRHPFEPDPSGGFSRTIFETDEDPNFKIIIRDFSFPPDRQTYTITLPSAALFHFLTEPGGEINIAKQRLALTAPARTVVPAGEPVDILNKHDKHLVARAFILEAK
jgi:hypothetical protein